MTRLEDLHRRLRRLRRRRREYRWTVGYSAMAIAGLWGLGAALAVDWVFQMDLAQRVVLLALWAAVLAWAYWRYTRPWLGQKETELDLALMVERDEHIDSDLVAAIQFESPEAPGWGSVQLEEAVIQGVAVKGKRLNVMHSLPRDEFARRTRILTATVAVWIIVTLVRPLDVATFLNRFFLGPRHYPSRTHIEAIAVNGQALDPVKLGQPPADQSFWSILTARADTEGGKTMVRVRYGQAARFEISCSGDLPESGRIWVTAVQSGLHATVDLQAPQKGQPPADDEGNERRLYVGDLPKMVEGIDYRIFLGDAWTETARVETTMLPVVDLELEVVPPPYANKALVASRYPKGLRQVSVLEGSQVGIRIRSNKPLLKATATLEVNNEMRDLVLERRDGSADATGGELWVLPVESTPLAAVVQPVRFSIQVQDQEEQQLEKPIDGMVRIQPDGPPRFELVAATTTEVLPTAAPTIGYVANDDHALNRVWLEYEVIPGGTKSEDDVRSLTGKMDVAKLSPEKKPVQRHGDIFTFDLTKIEFDKAKPRLVKGDTINVTMWVEDYRGSREGKSASAEPVIFHVTDQQGILSSMLEADKQSAQELKTMIQRQLGIGGTH